MINIKNEHEIRLMEESAVCLKAALKAIEENIRPGVSTLLLNDVAEQAMKEHGAIPAFKGVPCPYRGGKPYKWAICTSVNDEIIHGIPSSDVILKEGDIVSVNSVNTDVTIAQSLRNVFYAISGKGSYQISGAHSGVVQNNGSNLN